MADNPTPVLPSNSNELVSALPQSRVSPSSDEQLWKPELNEDDEQAIIDCKSRRCMERSVYLSAECGEVDVLRCFDWRHQKTQTGNNVLHVHLGRPLELRKGVVILTEPVSLTFIRYVLDEAASSSALLQRNDKGDTPLHLAARFGHIDAVKEFLSRRELVNHMTGLLNEANNNKDTALHDAARAGHASIVKLLVGKSSDYSSPQYMPNNLGETPIFLAVERGCATSFCVFLDLTTPSLDDKGPCGLTVLHTAVLHGHKRIVEHILDTGSNSSLIRVTNDKGRTPLHCCAAQNVKRQRNILEFLLRHDNQYNSAAYIQDNEGQTALHIATLNLNFEGAKMLIESYPDCVEIVDNKGQNMVHYAANLGCVNRFQRFLRMLPKCEKLMNEKDNDGNTPLHLLASTTPTMPSHGCFYRLPRIVRRFKKLDARAFNNKNLTAGDLIAANDSLHHFTSPIGARKSIPRGRRINNNTERAKVSERQERISSVEEKGSSLKKVEERIKHLRRAGETRLVVAALIATVSFTAGFTLPGGFNQNPGKDIGLAVLARKPAFIVFLVSDTVAFTLSCLATICYFAVASQVDLVRIERLSIKAHLLNTISLGALMVAFVTGVYAVVSQSPVLAFAVISISMFYFYYYLYLLVGSYGAIFSYITRTSRNRLPV